MAWWGWVYEIRNTVTGRVYIGSTQDERRWNKHHVLLVKGQHYNKALQADWDTYGKTAFTWNVLEQVDWIDAECYDTSFSIRLRASEAHHIAQAEATKGVYNVQPALGKFWDHIDKEAVKNTGPSGVEQQ